MRATTITTAIMATTTGCWGIPQTTKPHRQQQRQQQQHYNVINNATCDGRWQPSPRMAAPAKCLVHHSRVKQHAAASDSAFFLLLLQLLPLLLLLLLATAVCRCSCNKLAKISVRCGVWWISSCLSDFDECLQYCTHTHTCTRNAYVCIPLHKAEFWVAICQLGDQSYLHCGNRHAAYHAVRTYKCMYGWNFHSLWLEHILCTNAGPEFYNTANLMSFCNDSSKEVPFEAAATAYCCSKLIKLITWIIII